MQSTVSRNATEHSTPREAWDARQGGGAGVASAANKNVVWHPSAVAANVREQLLGHRPATLWLTGLSGAGKSTLAFALEQRLLEIGRACCVLDGDNVRHGLCRDLGFSPADRSENLRRVAEVARLMNDAGLIVITAFISPSRADRVAARDVIGDERFFEAWVCADLATCESRDPKGLYRKARAGQIAEFTGISAPYEPPGADALALDTAQLSIEACVDRMLERLVDRFL